MSIRYLSGINVDNNVLFVDDANNRVGIGTGSPNQTLEVKGADSSTVQAIFQATDSQAAYRGGIQLGNASGNQNSQIYHNSSGDNTLTFVSNYSAGTGNKFIFAPGGTETVRFLQNGNVLIGTTTDNGYKLRVNGKGYFDNNVVIAPTSESWAEGLSFVMPTTSTWGGLRWRRERVGNDGNWYIGYTALDSTDDLVFGANNGGTQVDNIIRLTKAGNVGIGTTAPGAKLQVSGTIATNSSLSDVDAYRIIKPNGGAFSTSTPSLTGAIRITYPVGFTSTMHRVKVNIYEYTTNESFTIYFGGYNYASNSLWYNEFAYVVNNPETDRNFTVRFGYNGTKMVVYIGELASTWTYPQVFIEEVELGFGGQSSAWRDDAWDIGFEATAFQNVSKTVSNPQATNWARNGSSTYYSLGNVGIGTTNPSYRLDVDAVSATSVARFYNSSNTATQVEIGDSGNSQYSDLILVSNSGTAEIFKAGTGYSSYGGALALNIYNSNGAIAFHPNGIANAMFINTSGNVGIGTTAPNAKLNVNTNAMGVTVSDSSGISLTNETAAAAGAQQMSPTLRWSGQGWATTPLASRNVSFISFLTPQQGTTNPSGILNFASSINGGAYWSVMSLTAGGALSITAGFSATTGVFSSTVTNTIVNLTTTPTDGVVIVTPTGATSVIPVRISPRLRISGTAWNTGGTPASNTMNWTIDNLSTSGNPPTSALRFNFDRNGGGYSTLVSFISNGNVGIGTTLPTEKLHVVGNVLITGTLEVDTVNNGSGDFLTRTSGGIVTRRTAAEVRSDIQASQYFTVSSSSWIPASTSGWFRLASTSGNQRGSVRVILSFVGGNFTPQNYIIDVTKDWSTVASLRVDVRTAQSQYISGVRVIQDTVNTSVYHLEANFASSLNPYQFDLSFDNAYGFNSTWTMATTAPLVASTNGTVILSKDIFLSGDYSTDLINTGNINISGNTLSSINTNGNIILSPNGSGTVGIGTTSPAGHQLDIASTQGAINNSAIRALYPSGGGLANTEFGALAYRGGVWTAVYGKQGSASSAGYFDGNVGIGTASPSQALHVSGSARVTGAYYDSNNEAGTSGQVLSSTGSGTDWITPATTTATSLYDLLPAARVALNWTGQVVNDTWTTVFSKSSNLLTTGTWMVKMYVSDFATGGGHYTYTYSGMFTWYQDTTNQAGEQAASEIYLHRMGHAANASVLYLRTTETAAASSGDGLFQIKGNYSNTSNQTISFQFVKIF